MEANGYGKPLRCKVCWRVTYNAATKKCSKCIKRYWRFGTWSKKHKKYMGVWENCV